MPPLSSVEVKARLRKPALGLLASAVWGIGVALFLGIAVAVEKLNRLPRFTEQDQNEVLTISCMLLAFLLVGCTIARGALAMLNARDLFAARNAAILAVAAVRRGLDHRPAIRQSGRCGPARSTGQAGIPPPPAVAGSAPPGSESGARIARATPSMTYGFLPPACAAQTGRVDCIGHAMDVCRSRLGLPDP